MPLRVLVIESQPEDILFLRDVLAELDGGPYWSGWTRIEPLFASELAEAADVLAEQQAGDQRIDLALLSLALPEAPPAALLRNIQSSAPQLPIIILTDRDEISIAERLVREGAQDYLIRGELDCAPLAHAIRGAIDRQSLLNAARATAMTDPLTGLMSRAAFLAALERDLAVAAQWKAAFSVLVAQPRDLQPTASSGDEPRRDLELMRAAELLREAAGAGEWIARLDPNRFAIAGFLTGAAASPDASTAHIRKLAAEHKLSIGSATFDPGTGQAAGSSAERLIQMAVSNLAADLPPKTLAARS